MKRDVVIMGRRIKHGKLKTHKFLRLWRTGKGRIENKIMDEHAILTEGRAIELQHYFFDENLNGIEVWIKKHLGVPSDKVRLYPFYKLPKFPEVVGERSDYIFVGEYSGSKGHDELLEAWEKLHEQGVDLTLHLTVSLGDAFLNKMQMAIEKGVHIVNHGYIPTEELAKLYVQCKATIYPSYNESFGLGLIEAMEAGCDVIASDRPFVHAICEPSETFDPALPNTIVDAVVRYETKERRQTILITCDKVDEMIEDICEK